MTAAGKKIRKASGERRTGTDPTPGRRRRLEAKGSGTNAVELDRIREEIESCERCPRLRAHCLRVAAEGKKEFAGWTYWGRPVPGFGDPGARLHVVGLAPAMHGGNRTGRVFTGDSSGDWLYEALHRYGFANQPHSVSIDDGLQLVDCYVCAVGRCAPPDNKPTPEELTNCRPFLEREIAALGQVRVVVALGSIALDGWLRASGWRDRLAASARPRFGHNRETCLPDGVTVIASYHPSRRNTNTGMLTRRMWYDVFERARALVDNVRPFAGGPRRDGGRGRMGG